MIVYVDGHFYHAQGYPAACGHINMEMLTVVHTVSTFEPHLHSIEMSIFHSHGAVVAFFAFSQRAEAYLCARACACARRCSPFLCCTSLLERFQQKHTAGAQVLSADDSLHVKLVAHRETDMTYTSSRQQVPDLVLHLEMSRSSVPVAFQHSSHEIVARNWPRPRNRHLPITFICFSQSFSTCREQHACSVLSLGVPAVTGREGPNPAIPCITGQLLKIRLRAYVWIC